MWFVDTVIDWRPVFSLTTLWSDKTNPKKYTIFGCWEIVYHGRRRKQKKMPCSYAECAGLLMDCHSHYGPPISWLIRFRLAWRRYAVTISSFPTMSCQTKQCPVDTATTLDVSWSHDYFSGLALRKGTTDYDICYEMGNSKLMDPVRRPNRRLYHVPVSIFLSR
jgi:hypothetical protein